MLSRLRVSDLARLALTWAISSLALIVADALLSGLEASSPWRLVMAAAVTGVFGVLIRPVLVKVATAIGWLVTAGSDDAFTTALRRFGGKGAVIADPEVELLLAQETSGAIS